MTSREPLSDERISSALADLEGWARDGDSISKRYAFGSFREAVGFIVRLAFICEEHDHHPELSNVYNRVTLTLSTHDAGNKITDMDLLVAREIEAFAWV